YIARSDARSGACSPNWLPRCFHSADGTMRTASNTRPLMRRKPICSASPNLSDGPRRASISARSLAVKLKNASISKPLSSRGNCLSPRNVACQWFIASLPDRDTMVLKNHEQHHIVCATKRRHSLDDYRHILPSLLEAKMRGPLAGCLSAADRGRQEQGRAYPGEPNPDDGSLDVY